MFINDTNDINDINGTNVHKSQIPNICICDIDGNCEQLSFVAINMKTAMEFLTQRHRGTKARRLRWTILG